MQSLSITRRSLCKDKEEERDKAGDKEEVVAWEVDVDQVETVYAPIVAKRFPMKGAFHVLK